MKYYTEYLILNIRINYLMCIIEIFHVNKKFHTLIFAQKLEKILFKPKDNFSLPSFLFKKQILKFTKLMEQL
jgi:hypothetical protein